MEESEEAFMKGLEWVQTQINGAQMPQYIAMAYLIQLCFSHTINIHTK